MDNYLQNAGMGQEFNNKIRHECTLPNNGNYGFWFKVQIIRNIPWVLLLKIMN